MPLSPEELAAAEELQKQEAAQAAAAEEARKAEEARLAEEEDTSKLSIEQLQAQLARERKDRQEANKEAQKLRQRANSLEEEARKRQEAEMSELEKTQARLKESETRNAEISQEAQNTRIMLAASRLGFQDPKDAVALINRSALTEGEANLDDLLKEVIKTKPYLAKGESKLPERQGGLNPGGGVDQAQEKETTDRAKRAFPTIRRLLGN